MNRKNTGVKALTLVLAALLSGCGSGMDCVFWCHDGEDVQQTYVQARDECQNLAEDKVGLFLQGGPTGAAPKEVNSALLALFAKCMHIQDWGVTAPKQETLSVPAPGQQQLVPQVRQNEARAGFGIGPGFGDVAPSQPQPNYVEPIYPYPQQAYPAPATNPQGGYLQPYPVPSHDSSPQSQQQRAYPPQAYPAPSGGSQQAVPQQAYPAPR